MGFSRVILEPIDMNIFEALRRLKAKQNSCQEELDEYGRDSNGVYKTDYTSRRYSDMCKDAAELCDDAFDGEEDAQSNTD